MTTHLYVDNVECWREVRCIDVIEAAPADMSREFSAEGDTLRSDEIRISRIRSVVHPFEGPGKHTPQSEHSDLVVYLQTKGSVVQIQDGREILIRQGDIASKDKTRPIAMKRKEEFEQVLVHIPRSIALPIFGCTKRFTSRELGNTSPLGRVVGTFLGSLALVIDELSIPTADTLSSTAGSLALALLAEHASVKIDQHGWGHTALRYRAEEFIRRHNLHAELTSKTVASALNVSLRSLQAAFHDGGTTPSEYIWECRLRNSEQDLTNGVLAPLNITDIALRNGFSDSAHFSRRFKDRFGMTPREYRQSKRAESEFPLRICPCDSPET
jgi:AraC-like DNA-binding protein